MASFSYVAFDVKHPVLHLGTSEVSIPRESEGKQSCQGGTIEVLGHVLSWKLIESLFFFFLSTKYGSILKVICIFVAKNISEMTINGK